MNGDGPPSAGEVSSMRVDRKVEALEKRVIVLEEFIMALTKHFRFPDDFGVPTESLHEIAVRQARARRDSGL